MKTLTIALLLSFGAFAQDSVVASCPAREFGAYTTARYPGERCDMWAADALAERRCKNARDSEGNRYENCRRKPGRWGAYVQEGGAGEMCMVTYLGDNTSCR